MIRPSRPRPQSIPRCRVVTNSAAHHSGLLRMWGTPLIDPLNDTEGDVDLRLLSTRPMLACSKRFVIP